MSAGAQIDYDKLAQQHGAEVDYDALAEQHGGSADEAPPAKSAFSKFLEATNPLGPIGAVHGEIADWAAKRTEQNRKENLQAAARGEKAPHSEAVNTFLGSIADFAKMGKESTEPKNLALAAGTALANTNPITGAIADTALIGHGGYTAAKNAPAALEGDPDAVQAGLLGLSEAAGGAAGVRGQYNAKMATMKARAAAAKPAPAAQAQPVAANAGTPTPIQTTTDSNGIRWASDGVNKVSIPKSVADADIQTYAGPKLQQQAQIKSQLPGQPAPAAAQPAATSVTAPAQKLAVSTALGAANQTLSPIEPYSALTKAIKPGTNLTGWDTALRSAAPDLQAAEAASGKPINSLRSFVENITTAKKALWAEYKQMLGPNGDATIDGSAVAQAMKDSVNARFRAQHPTRAAEMDRIADTYKRPLTLEETEDFLQSANGDLDSYYAKNKVARRDAMKDPETAPTVAEAEALRDGLYKKLDSLTGKDAAAIKKRYGALSTLEEPAVKRVNVWERQQPDSLQEQLNVGQGAAKIGKAVLNTHIGDALEGAGQMAVSKMMKQRSNPDWLIEQAFNKFRKGGTTAPPKPVPASGPGSMAATLAGMGLRINPSNGNVEQANAPVN